MFEVGQWLEDQYLLIDRIRTKQWIHYIAQDRISGNVFVVRRPSDTLCPEGFSADEFKKGARAWITLGECDQVIKAYLLKDFEGIPHLFLQYVDSPSLGDILAANRGKPLSMNRTAELMKQLVDAMKLLHQKSLSQGKIEFLHGCLTPRSILIHEGNVRITDIGMWNAFRTAEGVADIEFLTNSVAYTAPERIRDPGMIDSLTDIYSFGAIMYEVATGTLPVTIGNSHDPLSAAVGANLPPPRMRNRRCPRWVEETIMKCIAQDPEKRFQSFEQIDALLSALAHKLLSETDSAKKEKETSAASRVARVRGLAKKESSRLNQYYLGVEHLMLGLIAEEESIVVSSFGDKVTADKMRSEILSHLPKGTGPWQWEGIKKTPRYRRVMKIARQMVRDYNCERMLPQHILLAILQEGRSIPVRVLKTLGVNTSAAIENLDREITKRCSGIWFTEHSDISNRLTSEAPYESDAQFITPFVGREAEKERALTLLLEERKSLVVVGQPGVGKTAFVNQLGNLVREASEGAGSRGLFKLRIAPLLANAAGNMEQVLNDFNETIDSLAAEGAMLLIEDLPLILEIKGERRSRTAAGLLEECMISKDLPIVGTATPAGYADCETKNLRMMTSFEVINLSEPSGEETLNMMEAAKKFFECEYSVQILADALEAALNLSGEFNEKRALPARAFELLSRACAAARIAFDTPEIDESLANVTATQVEQALKKGLP